MKNIKIFNIDKYINFDKSFIDVNITGNMYIDDNNIYHYDGNIKINITVEEYTYFSHIISINCFFINEMFNGIFYLLVKTKTGISINLSEIDIITYKKGQKNGVSIFIDRNEIIINKYNNNIRCLKNQPYQIYKLYTIFSKNLKNLFKLYPSISYEMLDIQSFIDEMLDIVNYYNIYFYRYNNVFNFEVRNNNGSKIYIMKNVSFYNIKNNCKIDIYGYDKIEDKIYDFSRIKNNNLDEHEIYGYIIYFDNKNYNIKEVYEPIDNNKYVKMNYINYFLFKGNSKNIYFFI